MIDDANVINSFQKCKFTFCKIKITDAYPKFKFANQNRVQFGIINSS